MKIISKQEAIKQGKIYYYTGKKCKHGHDSVRLVKGGSCRDCKNEYAKEHRTRPETKIKNSQYHKQRHKETYTTEKRRASYLKHIEYNILNRARYRAKNKNIDFDLTIEDIIIPQFCPILGIEIKTIIEEGKENSPSLDRIDCKKGYTKDNVRIISNRANRLKSDATIEELEKILNYMKIYSEEKFVFKIYKVELKEKSNAPTRRTI